jgi:hypothetical protein
MLKAHWTGYEIDSSEAAYNVEVPEPEKLGTLVRALLGSDYFVRSYTLLSEESVVRLRDFAAAHSLSNQSCPACTDKQSRKEMAKVPDLLDKQIAKFNDRRPTTIGLRAIEPILNYVGAHCHQLLAAQTFRFDLTEEQEGMLEDYGEDTEFEPGSFVDESLYYSEWDIPWDGIVMALGCALVGAAKLSPAEQKHAYRITKKSYKESGLLDEMAGWGFGFGPPRDYVLESISRSQGLSLRVRLNPDATLAIHGRWMDDGQFDYPYYAYLLEMAAQKAQADIDFTMVYG